MKCSARMGLLAGITLATASGVALLPRFPQPLSYHNFADQRLLLGIPNCLNVISNVPFLVVGLWGVILVVQGRTSPREVFIVPAERWPYLVFFVGAVLTCFGSGYYHLAPDNATLVWDRLPMTLGFMSLLSATIAERLNLKLGLRLLGPLLALGLVSVVQWHISELRGAGDLRFYLMVQFFTLLVIPLMLLLFPARYTRGADLVVALGVYALAKVLESLDKQLLSISRLVSGHTLKHVVAALAIYWILRMLEKRKPVATQLPNGESWSSATA